MDAEALRYWLHLAIGVPMVLLWFGMGVRLAYLAAKGDSAPPIRRLAVATAIACGTVAAIFSLVIALWPAWYSVWIGQSLFLIMLVCFGIELNCLIWRKNPPRSFGERRLALGTGLYFGL